VNSEEAISYQVKIHSSSRQVLEVLPQITAGETSSNIQGFSATWISRAILSLGGQVEAVEPDEVRAAVLARAAAALENYH
jgi:predicted DNA-binding transcriptional regulator YafY